MPQFMIFVKKLQQEVAIERCNKVPWNENATTWDAAMMDGSPFQKVLVEPATLKFLNIQPRDKVLEIACGNGQMSRVMTQLGAQVTAIDSSPEIIKCALERSKGLNIVYKVLDVLDIQSTKVFTTNDWDGVLCNMALMDIPEIAPVFQLSHKALKSGGIFVFSVTHPCFDKAVGPHVTEIHEGDGTLVQKNFIKAHRYLTPVIQKTRAIPALPTPHFHYHRSLQDYFRGAFEAGFVISGIDEAAFPKETSLIEHKGWHNLSDIPIVLTVKLEKNK